VGDTGRAALVAEHLTDVVLPLHHHHEGEEQHFLKRMPAPVRVIWKLVGCRSYDGYVRLVRRSS
jgi:hypothetical protein